MSSTAYSLVQPTAGLLYDDGDEGSGSNASIDDAWGTPVEYDAQGAAAELEDEALIEHIAAENARYRREAHMRRGRSPRVTSPLRPGEKRTTRRAEEHEQRRAEQRRAEEERQRAEEEEQRRRMLDAQGPDIRAGDRLHADAKGKTSRLALRKAQLEEEARKKHGKECTFRPQITPSAKRQALGPLVERLHGPNKPVTKANSSRDREDEEIRKHCTFRPATSAASRRMASVDRGPVDQRLYRESEARVMRQKLREKHVGSWEKAKAIGGRTISKRDAEAAVDRMYQWNETKNRFLDTLREEVAKPAYSVHADSAQVVARLTHPTTTGDRRCEKTLVVAEAGERSSAAPQISERTAALAQTHRQARLLALFDSLDAHHVGFVSIAQLEALVEVLEPRNVSILSALRTAGIARDEPVRFGRFSDVLEAYERRFGPQSWSPPDDAQHTFRRKVLSEEEENLTFQPAVASADAPPAFAHVPAPITTDGAVHERLYRQAAQRDQVRQTLTQEMQASASASHRPSITSKGMASKGRVSAGDVRGASRSSSGPRAAEHSVEDVLLEIEDTLHPDERQAPPQRQPSTRNVPDSPEEERAPEPAMDAAASSSARQVPGLPPRSPTASRKHAHADPEAALDSAHAQLVAMRAARSRAKGSTRRSTPHKGEPTQANEDAAAFPRQARQRSTFPAEGGYNMPLSIYEFLNPVNVTSTERTSAHDRRAAPRADDLRDFGRTLMRKQLDPANPAASTSPPRKPARA